MKALRAIALLLSLSLLAGSAWAGLTASGIILPTSAAVGQSVTVVLQIGAGPTPVTTVVPTVVVSAGSVQLLTGPIPSQASLPSNGSATFTYTYSITGCGNVDFQGSASGYEASTLVTSNTVTFSQVTVSCPFSPTPTPTVTPSPTASPWIINATPTEVPQGADAKILGNKFHPGGGNTVGLRFTLPFGGKIRINIYNRQGQRVKSFEKDENAGESTEAWDGRGDQGGLVGSGIYVVQFQGKALNKVAKLVVIK